MAIQSYITDNSRYTICSSDVPWSVARTWAEQADPEGYEFLERNSDADGRWGNKIGICVSEHMGHELWLYNYDGACWLIRF